MTRPFKVQMTHTVVREYEVDAHTAEEAEDIAMRYYEDGEPGTVLDTEVEDLEAIPDDGGIFD